MAKKEIIGNYELVEQIGQGGFAKTFRAKHSILGEFACIKRNLRPTPEEESFLFQEARLLWRINHHSLPTLKDFVRALDGSYAMIMTYVEGKDLYKVVAEDYPNGIDPEHVCWMTQRLLNAVHYLHFYGIVHGDIKPHNIIIKPAEHNAILVDYGLATLKPTRRSSCPGYTEAFASPEQISGKPPIPQTDLFGLGLSMLYALGGCIQSKTYPPYIPPALKNFLNQMIRHNPMERPNSAEELVRPLSDLRELLFTRRASNKELKIS